ncbi:MAG: c-type cytochrome, partial [Proteobacteria bacterium]|nr:c-type cytochrome [Pseudomonadota bacterium]
MQNSRMRWWSAMFVLLSVPAGLCQAQSDHTYSSDTISTGYRIYIQNCALCHGLEGSWIEGIDLSRGQFRTVVSDHDLRGVISQGAADGRMPRFDLSDAELDGLIGYIRIGFDPDGAAVQIGSAVPGESLYHGAGACGGCHRINGRGSYAAPDLSDIGLMRTPAALQRTLVDPQASLLPINRPISIVTSRGVAI